LFSIFIQREINVSLLSFVGVPPEIVGDFNYYNPVIEKTLQHPDFENETGMRVISWLELNGILMDLLVIFLVNIR